MATITNISPLTGRWGDPITITGTGFTGALAVSFGTDKTYQYTVDSDTQITVKVPHGCPTDFVTVTASDNSTVTSAQTFTPTYDTAPTFTTQGSGTQFFASFCLDDNHIYVSPLGTSYFLYSTAGINGPYNQIALAGQTKGRAWGTSSSNMFITAANSSFNYYTFDGVTATSVSNKGFSGNLTFIIGNGSVVVGQDGTFNHVWMTTDNGATNWVNQNLTGFYQDGFTDGTYIYLVGSDAGGNSGIAIWNGTSWTEKTVETTQFLNTGWALAGGTLWVGGYLSNGSAPQPVLLLKSTDHGNTWTTELALDSGDAINGIFATSSTDIWVTGEAGSTAQDVAFNRGMILHKDGFNWKDYKTGNATVAQGNSYDLLSGTSTNVVIPGEFAQVFITGAAIPVSGPAPTISGISPTATTAGGTVTITGTGFTGTTGVKFNGPSGVDATSYTVVNDTTITAVVPAGNNTGVIAVSTANGTASSGQTFTEMAGPLQVTDCAIGFTHASRTGGTARVEGLNIAPGAVVQLGGVTASVTSNTGSLVICTVTQHIPAVVNLRVTNPDGTSVLIIDAFSYDDTAIPSLDAKVKQTYPWLRVNYLMAAVDTTNPGTLVYWTVPLAPDLVGLFSGKKLSNLADIEIVEAFWAA